MNRLWFAVLSIVVFVCGCQQGDFIGLEKSSGRSKEGLIALYTFNEGQGNYIYDVSGVGQPLDLLIKNPGDEVNWLKDGGISIKPKGYQHFESHMDAQILSILPATKIIETCKDTDELTIEVWLKPATLDQGGPCRIVTLSDSSGSRNVTVSQHYRTYDVRLRTTRTNKNGLPAIRNIDKGFTPTELTHVVYTYANPGQELYVNGRVVKTMFVDGPDPKLLRGDFSTWMDGVHVMLADEFEANRAFYGDIYMVAVYGKALREQEVQKNFEAGHKIKMPKKNRHRIIDVSEVQDEGQLSFRIETPSGTYYFHKEGAGFSSFVDIQGNDWIGYDMRYKGGRGRDRGIPNMGWTKFGHPGYENDRGSVSKILYHGNNKVTLHSRSDEGLYETIWNIYPTHTTQTIKAIDESYGFWWQYEGTPGGNCEFDTDFYVLSNGVKKPIGEVWTGDLEEPEWVYFVDAEIDRSLLMLHHESDDTIFTATPYPNREGVKPQMAVAGWARSEPCCDKSVFYKTTPHHWSFGFVEETSFDSVKRVADNIIYITSMDQ